MPPKTREYHLTTSAGRDLAWFFFRTVAPLPPKRKPEPPPPHNIPMAYRAMTTIAEEPGQARMEPADVDVMQAAKVRPGPRNKKPKPRKGDARNAGPWSEWYVSEDRSYLWRAREARNKTWDYQFTPNYQAQTQTQAETHSQDTTPATSSSELNQPLFPAPGTPPGSPKPDAMSNPASPKSSWPTILTTSTGQPTEDLSASSSRTLVTLPREGDDTYQYDATGTAPAPPAATSNGPPAKANTTRSARASHKRPVGPVMRLLQESRSRRHRARADATRSTTAVNTAAMTSGRGGVADKLPPPRGTATAGAGQGAAASRAAGGRKSTSGGGSAAALAKQQQQQQQQRATPALAKKLHAKVKSEKEMRVDPKRRVKLWLRKVEVDLEPIPLDAEGFPVYR